MPKRTNVLSFGSLLAGPPRSRGRSAPPVGPGQTLGFNQLMPAGQQMVPLGPTNLTATYNGQTLPPQGQVYGPGFNLYHGAGLLPSPYPGQGYMTTDPYGISMPGLASAQYQYGGETPPTWVTSAAAQELLPPSQAPLFSEVERRAPLRTAAWAEPRRHQLPAEVSTAISGMLGLIPPRLGLTAYYGDLARMAQEVSAPELGVARGYLTSRLAGGIPPDMLQALQSDIRTAQAARGLQYGPAAAAEEARRLTMFREQQRQALLGPAMNLGYTSLSASGLQLPTYLPGPAVGTQAMAQRQLNWARQGTWINAGMGALSSAAGLGALAALL